MADAKQTVAAAAAAAPVAAAAGAGAAASKSLPALRGSVLDRKEFVSLLGKLCGEVEKHLMNKPPAHVPEESYAARHVLDALKPYTTENGGPLKVKVVEYRKNRSNIIIEYPATAPLAAGAKPKSVSIVGSHLDVVFADPKDWKQSPFGLKVESDGDTLYGRGTTDCLGHVALMTQLFVTLAQLKVPLKVSVVGVIIADEEFGEEADIGVCGLMQQGELEKAGLKNGPVFWLDCADKQPNIGSGGMLKWKLTTSGKNFHSGFPHKTVNALELAMDVVTEVQRRFYADFPPHKLEAEYKFPCSSSLKPTIFHGTEGAVNAIKGHCVVEGDVRLTPFYKVADVAKAVNGYIADLLSQGCKAIEGRRGPDARYSGVHDVKAGVTWEWVGAGADGLACDLHSPGFKVLCSNTERVVGHCKPVSDTGTLPLVADLRAAGYDIQTIGYGVEDAYHADDEFARLSDFVQGFDVLCGIVADLHDLA